MRWPPGAPWPRKPRSCCWVTSPDWRKQRRSGGQGISRKSLAQQKASHALMCYVNADILLLEDFLPAVKRVGQELDRFLMVGRRWDLQVDEPLSFDPAGRERGRRQLSAAGLRHPPAGSDYFVFVG